MNVLPLVQQQHCTQIPDPLVCEPRRCDQFEAFQLSEMGRISQHVNIEKLCDVSAPPNAVLLPKGRSDVGTFFVDYRALLSSSSCSSDLTDQVPQSHRRRHAHALHCLVNYLLDGGYVESRVKPINVIVIMLNICGCNR